MGLTYNWAVRSHQSKVVAIRYCGFRDLDLKQDRFLTNKAKRCEFAAKSAATFARWLGKVDFLAILATEQMDFAQ